MIDILDIVRTTVGRRYRIEREEMRQILATLADKGLVELNNGWNRDGTSLGWANACKGITVISILADTDSPNVRFTSSNPGSIRYDQPGSMHPMLRVTLMFAPEGSGGKSGNDYDYLRRRTKRLLIVRQDNDNLLTSQILGGSRAS